MEQFPYGIGVVTTMDVAAAEERVRDALAAEGFGVLTEIDVAATMRAKLGVERPPYRILGACNPHLANRALEAEEEIGLLLPCNVVVYETPSGSVVAAMEPEIIAQMSDSPEVLAVAAEAKERLMRVMESLEGS